MDKYEKLQSDFNNEIYLLVNKKLLSESDAEIVRQTFFLCAKRINRIEASNFIEFARAEGLLNSME